jgi:hypothetical protein
VIINLHKSILFTRTPDERFAREYGLPLGTWTELWRRHIFLEYTIAEMCEYFYIKTGRKTTKQSMMRWKWRSEVYSKIAPVMKRGVRVVNSEFFGDNEMLVTKELLKNIRNSVTKESRTLI